MLNHRAITLLLILTGISQSHQSNMNLFRGDLTLLSGLILVEKKMMQQYMLASWKVYSL